MLTAGLLGLWFLVLTYRTIKARQTGSDTELNKTRLERRIRGHGNFAEFTPMILLLIGLAEVGGANAYVLWACAALLVVGRIMHGYAFSFTDHHPVGRGGGTALTMISLLASSLANLWLYISA
jgi:uncharacterized membrane protein YecN with MAPEG domain